MLSDNLANTIPSGTVVVGIDGSSGAERALRWAAEEARDHRRDLTLVSAVSLPERYSMGEAIMYYDQMRAEGRAGAHRMLADAREEAERIAPDVEVREVVVEADPRDALLQFSPRAATVVVGSRGLGPVRSLLLGSVGVAVVRHASCPVVVCRPGPEGVTPEGVVVGVEGSERSLPVLEYAAGLASYRRQPLRVVHSRWLGPLGDSREEQDLRLSESLAGLGEKYPDVAVSREAVDGPPEQRLVDLAEGAVALVVGGHAGGVASEILTGSVSTSVVEHARCAVVVVPAEER